MILPASRSHPGSPRISAAPHLFADLIGLRFEKQRPGHSRCRLEISEKHLSPYGMVHDAVAYALADTGMGVALSPAPATCRARLLAPRGQVQILYLRDRNTRQSRETADAAL